MNARNSCFRILNVVGNIGKVDNAINFALISNFQIPQPNLQLL